MKKKQPKPDNKEQSARFMENAESIKAENDDELFEKAITKVLKNKPIKKGALS